MLTIKTLDEADAFVTRQQRLGNDVRWDGWTMIFFRSEPRGRTNRDGAIRAEVWGFENRVPVNDKGTWEVDYRNVRRAKRTRP